jgi:hypothetical protein
VLISWSISMVRMHQQLSTRVYDALHSKLCQIIVMVMVIRRPISPKRSLPGMDAAPRLLNKCCCASSFFAFGGRSESIT